MSSSIGNLLEESSLNSDVKIKLMGCDSIERSNSFVFPNPFATVAVSFGDGMFDLPLIAHNYERSYIELRSFWLFQSLLTSSALRFFWNSWHMSGPWMIHQLMVEVTTITNWWKLYLSIVPVTLMSVIKRRRLIVVQTSWKNQWFLSCLPNSSESENVLKYFPNFIPRRIFLNMLW